jgi:hypothetical protein
MPKTDVSQSVKKEHSQDSELEKKKEQLQDTAKWVLAAFAAIAGLMLTGLKFSDVGKLQIPFIIIAAVAFTVAMVAIFLEIYLVTRVLSFGAVSEKRIREFARQKNNPTGINLNNTLLLDGYPTVDKFIDDYNAICCEYDIAGKEEKFDKVAQMSAKVTRLVETKNNLLSYGSYIMMKSIYFSAIRGLFIFGAIAAVGIAVFVWSIGKTPLTNYIYMNPPNEATVALTTAGQTALRDALGKECVAQLGVSIIVLSIDGGVFDVVSIPTDTCNVARFTVDSDTGLVTNQP